MSDSKATLRVLVCDDDPADRKLVRYCLKQMTGDGLTVIEAGETAEIEAALSVGAVDVVLMDLQMPGKSGMDWLDEVVVKRIAPVIMLTGYGNEDVAVSAIQRGAAGYISKNNLRPQKLADAVTSAAANWKRTPDAKNGRPASVLDQTSSQKLDEVGLETVKSLAMMAEMRDPYTAGHQRRVSELARALAERLKLSPDQVTAVRLAGTIHDIGKVRVPSEILTNPGKLTEAEFTIIKTHPQAGFEIIRNIALPWPIARIIHEHHERINGSGYPLALRNGDIAIESRILAVADVVEAMASHRPYRPAIGLDKALIEISTHQKDLYDPSAVEACVQLFKDGGFKLS